MSDSIASNLASIRRLQGENRLPEAAAACREMFREHPFSEVEALLGLLCCQTGAADEGRAHLDSAIKAQDSLSAAALTDLAGIQILLQQPLPAMALVARALALAPDYPPARVRRGLVFLRTGRWQAAIADLEFGLATLPPLQRSAVHINLARAHLGRGEPETALKQVRAARELDPAPGWRLYRVEVEALLALNCWADAEAASREALERGVEEKRCLHWFALVLAAQNRHDEAEHHLRKGLERYPDDTGLLLKLSELAQVRGRFGEALHCLRRGVALAPEDAALWAQLAQLARRRFDPALAREAAQKALELTRDKIGVARAQALTAMAGAASEDGQAERAERYYREALERFADHVPARLGLGHLLLQWGRIDEAVAEFEAVAESHPLAGYGALIHARQFPDDAEILARIETAAYLPSLEGPVKSSLLFDLAAAFEHRRDYAKAFHFANEANAASRRFLPYDAEAHRERCHRIMRVFSAEFFAAREGFGHPSTVPVFILGMPRSGTTLVEQIIAGHPEIHGAGEIGSVSPVIQSLACWERRSGSGREYPECADDLTAFQTLKFAEKVLEQLRAYAPEARHIVDKLPHNFENIGLIRLLFPNAAIIHVLREPRDVAVSNYFTDYQAKFGGMGFAYDLADIGRQLVDCRRLMAHWDRVLRKPILTLRYEDAVDDVETAARTLLDYIGVDWNPAVLDFQNLERAVKTASVWQVRQPIYRTAKAKWRHYADFLEPLEAALAEDPPPVEPLRDAEPLPPGLFFEGIEQLRAGRGREAEAVFRRLLDRYPQHAAATHFLGMALYQQGHHLKALKRIRQSLRLHPGHPDWYRNLSVVLKALGLSNEAAALKDSHNPGRLSVLD
jgi:tetratricopeptide (TPR) repeat protein